MVNRRTGTFSMEVKKTVDRGVRLQIKMFSVSLSDGSRSCLWAKGVNLFFFQRRVLKMHNDYYYTDIKGTPFRCRKSFIAVLNCLFTSLCLRSGPMWSDSGLIVFSVCATSVGVALSRGHGKFFFRGNVSVEAGTI